MSMRKSFVFTMLAGFVALLSATTQPVFAAESSCADTGSGCTTGNVPLDFVVNIPSMLRLRVGSPGTTLTPAITFDPAAAELGNGIPVGGTGGDLGDNGEVTVRVLANGGADVTVNAATTPGGLQCQAGGCLASAATIAWDQITVAGGSLGASSCNVTPPALNNAGSGSATYSLPGSVIDEDCSWVYTYNNSGTLTPPLDGTYGGTVTYTALTP